MTSGVESNASSNTESTGGDMRIRGELEQTIRRLLTAVDRTGVSPQKVSIYLTDNARPIRSFEAKISFGKHFAEPF